MVILFKSAEGEKERCYITLKGLLVADRDYKERLWRVVDRSKMNDKQKKRHEIN